MLISLRVLTIIPLIPPLYILVQLVYSDLIGSKTDAGRTNDAQTITTTTTTSSVGAELGLFLALGILGHVVTHRLIPHIKHYMLKRSISGKDLGKKGTKKEHVDM